MTNVPDDSLDERLIRAERWTPSMQERYRSNIAVLFQRRYSSTTRWLTGVHGMVLLMLGVLGGMLAWWRPPVDEPTWRLFMIIMAAGAVPTGTAFAWSAINGYFDRRTHGRVLLLAVVFILWGGLALLNGAWDMQDPAARVALILPGAALFLIAAGSLIMAWVEDLHYKTQERLLRIELRLSEMAERLEKRPQ